MQSMQSRLIAGMALIGTAREAVCETKYEAQRRAGKQRRLSAERTSESQVKARQVVAFARLSTPTHFRVRLSVSVRVLSSVNTASLLHCWPVLLRHSRYERVATAPLVQAGTIPSASHDAFRAAAVEWLERASLDLSIASLTRCPLASLDPCVPYSACRGARSGAATIRTS